MCCVLDIIIVGNGKMGFSLADQLASEDHSITIVDTHEAALRRAMTPEFSAVAHAAQSPYNGGDTSGKICRVLAQFDFAKPKTFYDGPVPEFNPKRSISL